MNASSSMMVPNSMPKNPVASTMCGGLMILTSSPYALCHQSSSGAVTRSAAPPEAETKAPIGPESPQIRTPETRSAEFPNVDVNIKYADERAASTPQAYIAICGADQKLSRPIDRCHEMSQ